VSDSDQFLKKAKESILKSDYVKGYTGELTADDLYIVWFAKTLSNWKALVSTDVFNSVYWEVTYNGAKKETYVDTYSKISNQAVSDQ
jgi:hypothetical protein